MCDRLSNLFKGENWRTGYLFRETYTPIWVFRRILVFKLAARTYWTNGQTDERKTRNAAIMTAA